MKNIFKKLFGSNSWGKHFSETVQRVGKNNAGFSLVELIVVIAIMAVLAAVAVIGVSIYIPKAQKAADEQLVSDIEYALLLSYQSGELTQNGYVKLSASGAEVGGEGANQIIAILKSMYGEDWADELALEYDGWKGMTSDQIFAAAYQNSSFNGNEGALIDQIGTLTNVLSDALSANQNLVGDQFKGYLQGLKDNGVDISSNQAISNAAVLYAADSIGKLEEDDTDAINAAFAAFYDPASVKYGVVSELTNALRAELGVFGAAAALYAHGEAFGQYVSKHGNSELLEDFHELDTEGMTPESALDQVTNNLNNMIIAAATDPEISEYALEYGSQGSSEGQYAKDVTAYLESMKKINANADKFTGNLGSAECYTDGTAEALLQAAISAGAMNISCENGEIAIWISEGNVNNTVAGIQN